MTKPLIPHVPIIVRAADQAPREHKIPEAPAQEAHPQTDKAEKLAEILAGEHKYQGPMLALRDRVKAGAYVKSSVTGRPRAQDAIGEAFDPLTTDQVIDVCCQILVLEHNPYLSLNIGQQSMNLRNRVRAALKRGDIELSDVIAIRNMMCDIDTPVVDVEDDTNE